ncbi:ATP-binding protein [Desulfocurvibacter africanus]|uniref:ATP-binding protein n=1 Tax=Desulfocurvibacter africanus TaxID=873 RepID=UPI00041AA933|nr:ATP-binding protein [Desulfocurvibacter africanus]
MCPDNGCLQSDYYCLWETEDREFKVGIIGTGPGFLSFLAVIFNEQYREFLPNMRLVGVAEPNPASPKLKALKNRNIPIHADWKDLLDKNPDLDLVAEFTGNRFLRNTLRQALPAHTSLLDHSMAVFVCGLHTMAQTSTHCRINLQEHQALLQAIIDEVREDIMLLDLKGNVVDANRSVCDRRGLSKEKLNGQPCWKVQTLEDGLPFCSAMDPKCPFLITRETGQKSEALMTRVDAEGHLRYFRVYSYPIRDSSGAVSHIMVMRRDITERTRRERMRQQAEKLAIIGEMSTFLAHEIRNPLFAIAGFTNSLLKSKCLSGKEHEKLQIIAEETKRLDHMLTSILNFARPARVTVAQTDLQAVTMETVELMSMGYRKQGIEFVTTFEPDLPLIMGEPEMIKQCLINIIKNSIEAMEHGGTIGISAGRTEPHVFLDIRDTGKGMTQAQLEQAFSPFFTTKDKGYGLGLAMIKKMIEESGGLVDISSKEGQGTTVTLLFQPVLAGDHSG